jgi:hypothetical protein
VNKPSAVFFHANLKKYAPIHGIKRNIGAVSHTWVFGDGTSATTGSESTYMKFYPDVNATYQVK